jgi:hypothetical protein
MSDVREDVEACFIADFMFQFVNKDRTLFQEHINKVFQNLEVECWSQDFSTVMPFCSYKLYRQ